MPRFAICLVLVGSLIATAAYPQVLPPDERLKADILLIVAHPDDETAVGSYLAKAVFDDHRRVAVVYCNKGTGGGNNAGMEQSAAMGAIREIEARQALASFGITNAWFLGGKDTPGQDLLASLEAWHHGAVLEDVVRLVRLTRPEVILTWLPHFVSGENHGDHQASGVIAVEAFDAAGNPTIFPAQVTAPRERADIANATEGLHAWQPKKIYFFSDASHEVRGDGPAFDINAVSPSRGEPYVRLAAKLHLPHLTQGDVSVGALEAFKSGDFSALPEYLERFRLLFGKSVVPAAPNGDVFEGIFPAPAPFAAAPGYAPRPLTGVSLELGGAFGFYRDFWPAHGIERIAGLVRPEIEVTAGSYLFLPLLLQNGTGDSVRVALSPILPEGWKASGGAGEWRLGPGERIPVQTFVWSPAKSTTVEVPVTWKALLKGKEIGSVTIRVKLSDWSLPE
jgi:LmbE family N-acetylglucosaminyl deacetylase